MTTETQQRLMKRIKDLELRNKNLGIKLQLKEYECDAVKKELQQLKEIMQPKNIVKDAEFDGYLGLDRIQL